jgi:hypothetical protein
MEAHEMGDSRVKECFMPQSYTNLLHHFIFSTDHLHLLAKLRPDKAISGVLRDLKANASGWLHDIFPALRDFSWQNGYGAFTVSASQVERVQKYIARQESHHRQQTFRAGLYAATRSRGLKTGSIAGDVC